MYRLGQNNDVEFELSSDVLDPIIIDEPTNWETDEKSFERAPQGGGTLLKLNNVFEMGKDAADYIDQVMFIQGFNCSVYLTKRGKDTTKKSEDWRVFYRNRLDPTSFKFKDNRGRRRVEASFSQGGLFDKILARYNDKYDLVNTKSADNIEIGELETIIEQVDGRAFFRRSELFIDDLTRVEVEFLGGDRDNARAIPFQVEINSDRESLSGVTPGADSVPYANDTYAIGQVGSLLYYEAPIEVELVLKGKVKLRMIDTEDGVMKLEYVFYETVGDDLIFRERRELTQIDTGVNLNILEYDFNDEKVVVPRGWSLGIVAYTRVDGGIGVEKIVYDFLDTKLTVKLDFKYDPTQALVLLPHELFERLLQKITGEKGLLISNLFGRPELGYSDTGKWATLGVASGFWARGFDLGEPVTDANGDLTPKKQLNISLKEAFESFNVPEPLYWGIIERNGKEYFRLEDYKFTQQDFIGVRLGRVNSKGFSYIPANNYETNPLNDELYTRLEVGYEKGGSEYEEVFGLSSPHGIAKWSTCLKEMPEKPYVKTSVIRADIEAYELARIKQSTFNPDEDTEYDQDLFFRHLKKVDNTWVLRKWQDDFEEEPKFIYSPNTTGNLLLTPLNCLLRHKEIFSTGLYLEPLKEVVFISSNCNSDLELDGLAENSSILNKDLGKPYINGWVATFEGKVFQSFIDELEGQTYVNGEFIPNWFGIYEFVLNDRIVQGKLIKTTVNGNGNHEIALI